MTREKIKKLIILNIPYVLVALFATKLGESWRLAEGANASEKPQGGVSVSRWLCA